MIVGRYKGCCTRNDTTVLHDVDNYVPALRGEVLIGRHHTFLKKHVHSPIYSVRIAPSKLAK